MAKTPSPKPTEQSVNDAAASHAQVAVINALPVATPENTPVPGGGRWRWDRDHWADASEAAADAAPVTAATFSTLE